MLPHARTQGEVRRLERAIAVLMSDEDEDRPPTKLSRQRLLVRAGLPPITKLVLVAAVMLREGDETRPLPTARALASAVGVHRVTAQKAIGSLRALGVLCGAEVRWDVLALLGAPDEDEDERPAR